MAGPYSTGKQKPWMRVGAAGRVAHDDYAESAFADAKHNKKMMPGLSYAGNESLVLGKKNKYFALRKSPPKRAPTAAGRAGRKGRPATAGMAMRLNPTLRAAATTVIAREGKQAMVRSNAVLRRQDQHEANRQAAAREKRRKALEKKAADVAFYLSIERLTSKAALNRRLSRLSKREQTDCLKDQVRHRTIGCGFSAADYGFTADDISLFSGKKAAVQRAALKALVIRMIAQEKAPRTKERLQQPAEPVVGTTFSPPKLGVVTDDREEHELEAAAEVSSLIEKHDNAELLALDARFKGKFFFDDGPSEYRFIEDIQWNAAPATLEKPQGDPLQKRFQAATVKVYAPNDAQAGQVMTNKELEPYGLKGDERKEMDRMIKMYKTKWDAAQRCRANRAGLQSAAKRQKLQKTGRSRRTR